eukprot:CAMPEP_0201633728 /NCGR_PEP_ID=MMETSP0493-20130528/6944_1 /ASSEMBLY_ACC=CAM_ASM_000838 /TAXON_ID=420259 /ORGANISM="Thalassiosira gravida, Strain GMp14c1" /LENGTH=123 /DNA_ID=CAMNT_0048105481 /DNA_START=121 /DNA_END=489 /DNA_ORIENTATION=+
MKLSLIALTTLLSTASAFVPSTHIISSSSALNALDGEEIREARTGFAPGHFTTIGGKANAGRTVVDGHEVRAARQSFAPGMFIPHSSTGAGGHSPAAPSALPAATSGGGAPVKKSYALGGGSW